MGLTFLGLNLESSYNSGIRFGFNFSPLAI